MEMIQVKAIKRVARGMALLVLASVGLCVRVHAANEQPEQKVPESSPVAHLERVLQLNAKWLQEIGVVRAAGELLADKGRETEQLKAQLALRSMKTFDEVGGVAAVFVVCDPLLLDQVDKGAGLERAIQLDDLRLVLAYIRNNPELVNSDICAAVCSGYIPLMSAVHHGKRGIAQCLLDAKSRVDAVTSDDGNTALGNLLESFGCSDNSLLFNPRHEHIIRDLIMEGASLDLKNKEGKSPRDMLKEIFQWNSDYVARGLSRRKSDSWQLVTTQHEKIKWLAAGEQAERDYLALQARALQD